MNQSYGSVYARLNNASEIISLKAGYVTVRVLFQLTLKVEYYKHHKIYRYYSINMFNVKKNIQQIVQNEFSVRMGF